MAIVYVDGLEGDDGNTGSGRGAGQAKQTLAGARAALTAGNDIILIRPTIYLEGNITFSATNDDNTLIRNDPFYPGVPIFDYEFRVNYLTGTLATNAYMSVSRSVKFFNLHFRDMASNAAPMKLENANGWVVHCIFEYRGGGVGGAGVGTFNSGNSNPFNVYNNTFINIQTPSNGEGTSAISRNNYAPNSSTINPDTGGSPVKQYNAYSGNLEATGIDTDVTDPGLRDIANLDFRLDPTTIPADYQALITGGFDGGRIGAFGKGGLYYNNKIPQFRFLTPDPDFAGGNPQPGWENEGPGGTATYSDGDAGGTAGDLVEDGSTFAIKIDLGAIPTATGGRMRSDVIDLGSAGSPEFVNAVFSAFEDGSSGALVDTNTTLPQTFEVRYSPTAFLKGDGDISGGGGTNWTEIQKSQSFAITDRYLQFRVTLRTNHTNA
jgi:hypothetical protein